MAPIAPPPALQVISSRTVVAPPFGSNVPVSRDEVTGLLLPNGDGSGSDVNVA
jgi:hypothetical protein